MFRISESKGQTPKVIRALLFVFLFNTISFFVSSPSMTKTNDEPLSRRVPAEWEAQDAVWLQWPGYWEKSYEKAFAEFSRVILQYEKLHIICNSINIENDARRALHRAGVDPENRNIIWHLMPNDNAWMRDNGPVYVIEDGILRVQNWKFNAWGGAFGEDLAFNNDNAIPIKVGEYLGVPIDQVDIVHERGNLEFNGIDTVIVNWSTLGDPNRNPGYTLNRAKTDLKNLFGVSRVIFIEGVPEGDLTRGHIDGIARFINPSTVVVAQCTDGSQCKINDGATGSIFENAAELISNTGLTVLREPIETYVNHKGRAFDTNYMNWIVGDGYVVSSGFGDTKADTNAKARLQSYFPGRDVYVIEMLESWAQGGGIHCHTSDQPSIPHK